MHEKYSTLVHMVPGEADPFCALAANSVWTTPEMDMTIFSDDSDMLIYPASPKTCVVSYRNLENTGTPAEQTLSGFRYRPHNLARRLGNAGDGLIEPAFYMHVDPYCTFEGACRKVREGKHLKTIGFADFAQQFHVTPEMRQWEDARQNQLAPDTCPDARISEFIHQLEERKFTDTTVELELYLPFLIEDPARSTAWHAADEIRSLAYSIPVMLEQFVSFRIKEFHRSNGVDGIKAVVLDPLQGSDLQEQVHDLSMSISDFHSRADLDESASFGDNTERIEQWRCFVAQRLILNAMNKERTPPTAKDLIAAVMHDAVQTSWERQQLAAEYQAMFYSFRMLKELLKYSTQKAGDDVQESIRNLDNHMSSFPTIAEFFAPQDCGKQACLDRMIREVVASNARPGQDDEGGIHEERRKKRRKKKSTPQSASQTFAANPYSLLAD